MSENSFSEYKKDARMPCKYGAKCYQKNTAHHEKYKHPIKDLNKRKVNDNENLQIKKQKLDVHEPKKQVKLYEMFNTKQSEEETKGETSVKEVEENKAEKHIENILATSFPRKTLKDFNESEFIKSKFLVTMPDDFYKFWEFCKTICNKDPSKAFTELGLFLIGPFDVLANKFNDTEELQSEKYLLHWRYFYDIPEFQTVIKGDDSTGFHMGYFRDDPNSDPVFVAGNNSEEGGEFVCMGENIFAAVFLHLESIKKKQNPFKKMQTEKMQSAIKSKAEELHLSLSAMTPKIKARNNKSVTRSLNKAGLVVPYNKKSQQGYRELSISDRELKSLLQRYKSASPDIKSKLKTELEEVFRWANIAVDECDFGTGIELGWDLIYSGIEEFNSVAARFLINSYNLLNREIFATIVETHMQNRTKGCNLSII